MLSLLGLVCAVDFELSSVRCLIVCSRTKIENKKRTKKQNFIARLCSIIEFQSFSRALLVSETESSVLLVNLSCIHNSGQLVSSVNLLINDRINARC